MNKGSLRIIIYLAILCFIVPINAYAGDTKLFGFLRAGAAMSLENHEIEAFEDIDKNGDFSTSTFGLNISHQVSSNLHIAAQFFSAGYEDNFNTHLDWGYASFSPTDELTLNFGKIKYPVLLYSEVVDIGNVYLWTAPPQELYNAESEGAYLYLESFLGSSVVHSTYLGNYEIITQLIAGNGSVEVGGHGSEGGHGTLDKMIGGSISINDDFFTLKSGFNRYYSAGISALDGSDVNVISLGAKIDWNNFIFATEYVKGMVSDNSEADTSVIYATLGYRINAVTPHISYSKLEAEEGRNVVTAGLKYQFLPSTTIKLDYLHVSPEAEHGASHDEEAESFGIIRGALDLVF